MPWKTTKPTVINRHTLKAQKLDRKADRKLARNDLFGACETRNKADKAARKGGWF